MLTNDQKEARAERVSIMRAENVPDEFIQQVLNNYPELYGHSAEIIEEVAQ